MVSSTPARTMTSCSGWIVATMSRIGPDRGRSISASRMSLCSSTGAERQVLVLEGGHLAVREAEPAPDADAHRLGPAGPVERHRDLGPPVDHERLALLVVHVPAADVEGLVGRFQVVQPAEEQRHLRVVLELLHPPPDRCLEELGVHRVRAVDLQRAGLLPHLRERGAGVRRGSPSRLGGSAARRVRGHDKTSAKRSTVREAPPRYLSTCPWRPNYPVSLRLSRAGPGRSSSGRLTASRTQGDDAVQPVVVSLSLPPRRT